MKKIITAKEAKDLNRQGYNVVAGELVDLEGMPEWLRERAEREAKPMSAELVEQRRREAEFAAECARPWTGSELRGLAKALGVEVEGLDAEEETVEAVTINGERKQLRAVEGATVTVRTRSARKGTRHVERQAYKDERGWWYRIANHDGELEAVKVKAENVNR